MKYIIMCGGEYPKWKTPRQMIRIRDEPIVARTIRLLRAAGVEDIAISTHDKRFEAFGVPLLEHENHFNSRDAGSWVEAFYPTDAPCCYIMGDVVFSPEAIEMIVQTVTTEIMFFASSPPFSQNYIKGHAEPFAFKVVNQQRFQTAVQYVKQNEKTGIFSRRPIAWELWQVINCEDPKHINFHNYTAINDYTCDVDSEADAEKIREVVECI